MADILSGNTIMPPRTKLATQRSRHQDAAHGRMAWVARAFFLAGLALAARFFQLQVLDYHIYHVLASDQHEVQAALIPRRGTIYLKDHLDGSLFPIAKDRDTWQVYAVPREIKNPFLVAEQLTPLLNATTTELFARLSVSTSSYTLLTKDTPLSIINDLETRRLPGIGVTKGLTRWYPEQGLGGHLLGFVSTDDQYHRVGKYGLEGYFQKLLAGEFGSLVAEKDATGRRLTIGTLDLKEAKNGSDLVLTIDRTIQYEACAKIEEAVKKFEGMQGTIIVMDPQTGAIYAMCSTPDFDPANYGKISDIGVLNNPATFYQFEPGSIFKPLTIAAGLEAGKINPNTTYNDTGEETMDDFTVRNSDKLAHGVQTMTQVLEKSLNTGTIFVQRLLGKTLFRDYVLRFGLGERTNIEVPSEAKGNLSSLEKKGKIFAATASYGQGISATPIQLVTAFGALGNGGKLMKPYLVQTIIHPDGSREETKPQVVRQAVSPRTSRLVSGMLVSVVENGHGKRAAVPGYYVAGKTGTAQIADPRGGYLPDASIGSFVGYAPADNPKFVMLVKIDRPKTVAFAESSAAPTFGELAKFLLDYFQVPPERPIVQKAPDSTASSTPSTH